MTDHVFSPLRARLSAKVAPAAAALAASMLRRGRQAAAQLVGRDWIGSLIRAADWLEAGVSHLVRLGRRLCGNRLLGLGAPLAWRLLAALTGIWLATLLATAVSSSDEEPMLSSALAANDTPARPLRDVRQEPRSSASGEEWQRLQRPVAMFDLQSPELDQQPAQLEAYESANGRRHQDRLDFGSFDSDRPHLHLRLQPDHEGAGASPQPFLIGLVRDAAGKGLSVQRSGQASGLLTRFGPVETADVTLTDGHDVRACIAFRKQADGVPLALAGWWCGAANRPADRQQLVCLIDRIDLRSAGDDLVLRAAFARTELQRNPACIPPRLSATGRKTSWLDPAGSAPALRTKSAAAADKAAASRR
ncbi:MAG: hypothetical protein ACK4VM_02180 [Bosea sp. (in: a-proteobacteria)]